MRIFREFPEFREFRQGLVVDLCENHADSNIFDPISGNFL